METLKTADQVKKEHIEKLGSELGTQYNLLYNEIIFISFKFQEYRYLYIESSESKTRISVMNQTASFFFKYFLRDLLWNNILLGISRIIDPPKTGKKRNITIQNLPSLIEDKDLKKQIEDKIKSIIKETEFCRDWRNRWISHFDYDIQINKDTTEPLIDATVGKVKNLLKNISNLLNLIQHEYFKSNIAFDIPISDCSNLLIDYLKIGMESRVRSKGNSTN